MTFEEWQQKHGPNGGAYDIEMMRAGWDAATRIEREACAKAVEGMSTTLDGRSAIRNASGSFYKGSPMFYATCELAGKIRARGG